MSGFSAQQAVKAAAPPDPFKHVNYNLGMVLGVDDLDQEFAFHSGRDQWLTREAIGYGTVCGLRITIEVDAAKGPRVVVAAGTAIDPTGKLVRVTPAQGAYLNAWMADPANASIVRTDLEGSPPGNSIRLYVVLSYHACPTDAVPIAGEPCRSEDDATAPSRWTDDFSLELRAAPPDQDEEDGDRDFFAWLDQVSFSDGPGPFTTLALFEADLRAASNQVTSPPGSPPEFAFGSPPASLVVHTSDAGSFLRAAMRIWVTELRPTRLGTGQTAAGDPPTEDGILLAELTVPVVKVALDGSWAVGDATQIVVDENRRPFLLPLRMLQEWKLSGLGDSGGGALKGPSGNKGPVGDQGETGAKGPPGDPFIIASGMFNGQGKAVASPFFATSGLQAVAMAAPNSMFFLLTFPAYKPAANYVVKGTVLTDLQSRDATTFAVIQDASLASPGNVLGVAPGSGIVIRVMQGSLAPSVGFMVEISQF